MSEQIDIAVDLGAVATSGPCPGGFQGWTAAETRWVEGSMNSTEQEIRSIGGLWCLLAGPQTSLSCSPNFRHWVGKAVSQRHLHVHIAITHTPVRFKLVDQEQPIIDGHFRVRDTIAECCYRGGGPDTEKCVAQLFDGRRRLQALQLFGYQRNSGICVGLIVIEHIARSPYEGGLAYRELAEHRNLPSQLGILSSRFGGNPVDHPWQSICSYCKDSLNRHAPFSHVGSNAEVIGADVDNPLREPAALVCGLVIPDCQENGGRNRGSRNDCKRNFPSAFHAHRVGRCFE